MFKNTLLASKDSLKNLSYAQVKVEDTQDGVDAQKYGCPSGKKKKVQKEIQDNKENIGSQSGYPFRKREKRPAWQDLLTEPTDRPLTTKLPLANGSMVHNCEICVKQEPISPSDKPKHDPKGHLMNRALSPTQKHIGKPGRPSLSQGDSPFNISNSQIHHFLQCAGERWLTGNEYANLLIHSDTLGPMLGIKTIEGSQHPREIYFEPRNGTLYFLKDVPDVKKLGFPPILEDRPGLIETKRVNTKLICWKRMNFVTQLPKSSPKVEYVVASGRSSKLKWSNDSSGGSSSECDTFYRMHIVWLYGSTNQSDSSQSRVQPTPVKVLCHILQISAENILTVKMEEEDERFEPTPVRPAPNKNVESRYAMTAAPAKLATSDSSFTPLAKRKPQTGLPKNLVSWKNSEAEKEPTQIVAKEEPLESRDNESQVKPQTSSPLVFKWKSSCKRSTKEACSARLPTLFGLQSSNGKDDEDWLPNRSRTSREDCTQIRRVLFGANPDTYSSMSGLDSFAPREPFESFNKSRETSGHKFLQTPENRLFSGFRPPESDYKQMLKLEEREEAQDAVMSFSHPTWSPLFKYAQEDFISQNRWNQSRLGSYSRDCNQQSPSPGLVAMRSENFQVRAFGSPMGEPSLKQNLQNAYSRELQTPSRTPPPFSLQDSWQSQTPLRPTPSPKPSAQPPLLRTLSPPQAAARPPRTAQSAFSPHQPAHGQQHRQQQHQNKQQQQQPNKQQQPTSALRELRYLLDAHSSLTDWQSDPRVMQLLAGCPLFVLWLQDALLGVSDASESRGLGGRTAREMETWKVELVRRLEHPRFGRFVAGLGAEEARHATIPDDLVNEGDRDDEGEMEEAEIEEQAVKCEPPLETNQTFSAASEHKIPPKGLDSVSKTNEPPRESKYSQWVRVMYAQKILGLANPKPIRKRD